MSTTRYYDYSAEDKLALNTEDLLRSIEIEAAERGIAVPIRLAEFIQQQGYNGFTVPADAVGFYQIMAPSKYGSVNATGVCFKSEEEAWNALKGAVCILEDGYAPKTKNIVVSGEFGVSKIWLTTAKQAGFSSSINEYETDREEFDKLCEEINTELREMRQRKYNEEVIAAKKVKYLELANDDEAVAKRFWANIEKSEWPQ